MVQVVEVIFFKTFKQKINITKTAKGKVTVFKNYVMIERVEQDD